MLSIFLSGINEYFNELGDLSFADLIPFLLGIVIGFALCFLIYVLILIVSIKKDSKNTDVISIENKDDEINVIIENYKNRYTNEASSKKTGEKIEFMKNISWELINDIAKTYYPNSQYPIFELTIEELISLDYYIMKRIEKIFSGKILSKVKKMKISTIIHILDMKKKYDENKIVKTTEKLKIKSIFKGIWTAINFLNPVYWVKKLMFDIPYNIIINKISSTIIDVIGIETSNIYSKKAFVEEDEKTNEMVKEIEKMIGEENND